MIHSGRSAALRHAATSSSAAPKNTVTTGSSIPTADTSSSSSSSSSSLSSSASTFRSANSEDSTSHDSNVISSPRSGVASSTRHQLHQLQQQQQHHHHQQQQQQQYLQQQLQLQQSQHPRQPSNQPSTNGKLSAVTAVSASDDTSSRTANRLLKSPLKRHSRSSLLARGVDSVAAQEPARHRTLYSNSFVPVTPTSQQMQALHHQPDDRRSHPPSSRRHTLSSSYASELTEKPALSLSFNTDDFSSLDLSAVPAMSTRGHHLRAVASPTTTLTTSTTSLASSALSSTQYSASRKPTGTRQSAAKSTNFSASSSSHQLGDSLSGDLQVPTTPTISPSTTVREDRDPETPATQLVTKMSKLFGGSRSHLKGSLFTKRDVRDVTPPHQIVSANTVAMKCPPRPQKSLSPPASPRRRTRSPTRVTEAAESSSSTGTTMRLKGKANDQASVGAPLGSMSPRSRRLQNSLQRQQIQLMYGRKSIPLDTPVASTSKYNTRKGLKQAQQASVLSADTPLDMSDFEINSRDESPCPPPTTLAPNHLPGHHTAVKTPGPTQSLIPVPVRPQAVPPSVVYHAPRPSYPPPLTPPRRRATDKIVGSTKYQQASARASKRRISSGSSQISPRKTVRTKKESEAAMLAQQTKVHTSSKSTSTSSSVRHHRRELSMEASSHIAKKSDTTPVHCIPPGDEENYEISEKILSPTFRIPKQSNHEPARHVTFSNETVVVEEEKTVLITSVNRTHGAAMEEVLAMSRRRADADRMEVDEDFDKENADQETHQSFLVKRSSSLTTSTTTVQEDEEEEDPSEESDDEFDPFAFLRSLPPIPEEYLCRPCILPIKTRSCPAITLVLDLDETLVHCSISEGDDAPIHFDVDFNGTTYQVYARVRPYCKEFLEAVSRVFEVVIFTASQREYADKLLDILDPEKKYIKHRVFRDSCVYMKGNYLKDLSILGRDLSQVVIVDNAIQAFAYQLSNGIPIESWFSDMDDKELLSTLDFLKTLEGLTDVRPHVREKFRLHEYI